MQGSSEASRGTPLALLEVDVCRVDQVGIVVESIPAEQFHGPERHAHTNRHNEGWCRGHARAPEAAAAVQLDGGLRANMVAALEPGGGALDGLVGHI